MSLGSTSPADDVLDQRNLAGKRVLVTGVSSGVGVETARVLAAHGASVVGTAHNLAKGAAALDLFGCKGNAKFVALDLSSFASVSACADLLLADAQPFDAIIANAGVMAVQFALTSAVQNGDDPLRGRV